MTKEGRGRLNVYILVDAPSIDDFPHADDGEDQKHQEQHQEKPRKELGNRKRRPRDAGEPEESGQETDNEKDQRELKHGTLLCGCVARTVPA